MRIQTALLVLSVTTLTGSIAGGSSLFECPAQVEKAKNDIKGYFDYYDHDLEAHDWGRHLEGFRERGYSGRRATYEQMKGLMRRFKKRFFGEYLNNGDIFYESASGEGMNTLITYELLRDELGLENITAYGSDYLEGSVAAANAVFRSEVPGWNGKFCQGDSTNLSFIPSGVFDLAYTGNIDELVDPLRLGHENMTFKEMIQETRQRCESKDSASQRLAAAEQPAQEEWHSSWVKELLRVVKPGKIVIVEDMGYPICNDQFKSMHGGVAVEWWFEAARKYDWDTDPESIQIVLYPWYNNNYNIIMRRRAAQETSS